ncbi:hypothetical protein F4780DRAFT_563541 [Xylariomycetidae sp. FL0641]|nr:hypothetical protein F4780DRAFT_563541 [Xylariomycetidae sp. FL0641]
MPRKGSSKVRTGCLTCKVRKVKCDEGKPHCQRCVSTKRKCDGYAATPPSGLLWHRPRHIFANVDDAGEKRSLQFFSEAAAPFLAGPLDPYFWTHLVLQFSSFEPAVLHALVAVSSLYEQVRRDPRSPALLAGRHDSPFALRHYNAAIRALQVVDNNEPLVLLVCVLFVCLEFLRGNRNAAAVHCSHGVEILARAEPHYAWAREYLSPIFRRLSVVPLFFKNSEGGLPRSIGLDVGVPPTFASLGEAQFALDGMTSLTVRLIRNGAFHRFAAPRSGPVSAELLGEQAKLHTLLTDWFPHFTAFASTVDAANQSQASLCNLWVRYGTTRIWAEMAFAVDETGYDAHIDAFKAMVDQCADLATSTETRKAFRPPSFTFEMGFTPLLYYIVMKCRCLPTRLKALALMRLLGAARENLWEMPSFHAAGKRVVEIEHGVVLDGHGRPVGEAECPGLPPDGMRIRDSGIDPTPVVQTNANGEEVTGKIVRFFMPKSVEEPSSVHVRAEFIEIDWSLS